MPNHETIVPGLRPHQHCVRCGADLGELRGPTDYDPAALCPACQREAEHV